MHKRNKMCKQRPGLGFNNVTDVSYHLKLIILPAFSENMRRMWSSINIRRLALIIYLSLTWLPHSGPSQFLWKGKFVNDGLKLLWNKAMTSIKVLSGLQPERFSWTIRNLCQDSLSLTVWDLNITCPEYDVVIFCINLTFRDGSCRQLTFLWHVISVNEITKVLIIKFFEQVYD